ncbi:MAG TPA: thiol reductant ABC exporter subunit CydD [Xanthomonadaceae bacterium]|nr:thiol reductant ABC exporter subunit CydD [Xanthomonadaceae bacterium]
MTARRRSTGRPRFDAGGSLQLAAALVWIPQAWYIAIAVGAMSEGAADMKDIALRSALGVLVLGIIRACLASWGERLAFGRARRELSRLRGVAVRALSLNSPLDATRVSSGEAASIVAEQAEAVVPYFARYQPVQLRVMAVPLALLVIIARESWLAALVLLLAAPLIPFFMALVGWRAQAASEEQMLELGQMNGFLLDRLRGLTTIRAFDAVDIVATRLRESAEELRRRTMIVLRVAFLSSAVLELFSALGVAMVAVYVGFHLLGDIPFGTWGRQLSLTEGMFVLLLAPSFFEPLRDLASVWHDRASGAAALDALARIGACGRERLGSESGPAAVAALPYGPVGVEVAHLAFAYDNARAVLQDFDLAVEPGERIALVAPSGGGKSTVLALLAGLARPDAGVVRIGGVELDDANADALRARMAWVGQQPHVFAGSLGSNVALGRREVSDDDVAAALAIAAFPEGKRGLLKRPLGEGGLGLSGGEALRLAIARAAASDDCGLVLADEPTAHLDTETADAVMQGLLGLAARGATLIVATHDERLISRMDRVVAIAAPVREGDA